MHRALRILTALPLLGGAAVYVAFTASILLNAIFLPGMKTLLLGGSVIFFMGLVDDVHPLPALLKFTLQVAVALFVVLVGGIQLTFFFGTLWEPMVNIPLTVLWMVGLTNAMNFFDGIDGLAASMSIVAVDSGRFSCTKPLNLLLHTHSPLRGSLGPGIKAFPGSLNPA